MNKFKYFLMNLIFSPVYDEGDILVCYASQTGTAANLSQQTADLIRSRGCTTTVKSLADLQPSDLNRFKKILMIISTCGEGDIPDNGAAFYEALKVYPSVNTPISILALGDKSYKQFCTAGKLFYEEFDRMGANVDELVLADGNPMVPWQNWLNHHIQVDPETTLFTATEQEITLELLENRSLHSHKAEGNQAHRLTFKIHAEPDFRYIPGDLLGIAPPDDQKERLYSIASGPSVAPDQVELCVGVLSYEEEGKTVHGKCSHYLTKELQLGDKLQARWKSGGGLTLPEPEQPLIMIATGAGIAPMMCLLQERTSQQHTGNNWLLFGNRKQDEDFYYREDLEIMANNGQLQQLHTAFSRDGESKYYVQDALQEHQHQLAQWLLEDNARLYICGRTELKDAILDKVEQALGEALCNPEEGKSRVTEMQKSGQLSFELF